MPSFVPNPVAQEPNAWETAGATLTQSGVENMKLKKDDEQVRSMLVDPKLGSMLDAEDRQWILAQRHPAKAIQQYFKYTDEVLGNPVRNYAKFLAVYKSYMAKGMGPDEALKSASPYMPQGMMEPFMRFLSSQQKGDTPDLPATLEHKEELGAKGLGLTKDNLAKIRAREAAENVEATIDIYMKQWQDNSKQEALREMLKKQYPNIFQMKKETLDRPGAWKRDTESQRSDEPDWSLLETILKQKAYSEYGLTRRGLGLEAGPGGAEVPEGEDAEAEINDSELRKIAIEKLKKGNQPVVEENIKAMMEHLRKK